MSTFQVVLFVVAPFLASGIAAFFLEKLWADGTQSKTDAVPEKTARHSEQVDQASSSSAYRARMRREELEDHLAMAPRAHTSEHVAAKPAFTRVATAPNDASIASANSPRYDEPGEFIVPYDFSLAEFSGRRAD